MLQIYVGRASFLVVGSPLRTIAPRILCVCSPHPFKQKFISMTTLSKRPSMHGTLLDQRVFESLVQKYLPIIHDHFQVVDVQLSVASLPWFLSL